MVSRFIWSRKLSSSVDILLFTLYSAVWSVRGEVIECKESVKLCILYELSFNYFTYCVYCIVILCAALYASLSLTSIYQSYYRS